MGIINHVSGIQAPDCSRSTIKWKNDDDTIICQHIIIKYFWHCHISLVRFSYWSKFHVSIMTGSGVVTFFVYEGNRKYPHLSFVQYLETGLS